jgi:gliding motility-associated lipoprotein GldD
MRNRPASIRLRRIMLPVLLILIAAGCHHATTPKPRAYFRIDFPEKEYRTFTGDCPFSFEYPVYGEITDPDAMDAEPCWYNIDFPPFKGRIYLTYKPVDNNLSVYLEDIRSLAYKHIIKADDIIDIPFSYPGRRVYGIVYDIRGNTASSVSFFATDSIHNFLSGSLYFSVQPNIDSLSPVISFFREDIMHLIETLTWN